MNLSEKDSQLIWHPFTQHQTALPNIAIVKGKDALLWDENGKEYIDAVSSWWTNIFGHANHQIANAIKLQSSQLEHVIFAGFTHQPAIEVAEKVLRILPPNQQKVFFSDNGSTAVEVALKMAIQYWYNQNISKKTIIAFNNAYHGDTFGAMSVGARGYFNQPFESFLFDVKSIELPTPKNFEHIKETFISILEKQEVAAFIFEPLLQGSAGMLMYDAVYLEELIALCHKYNVLCIADEVMTGFGRTGNLFAADYLTNKPDIFCLSKGITGGFLPLGLTTCTAEIYAAFLSEDKLKTFFHGHSYTGNPLACAAASASLDLLQNAMPLINELEKLQHQYSAQLAQHPNVENLRQIGTVVAFEVKNAATFNYFNHLRDFLYQNFIARGVILRPLGNTVYVLPPYVITAQQLEKVYKVIVEVLNLL
jgi:adenosylmethionine-8-amino-7-oxononanoate aminotransferase